jgi:hypothetical protein
MNAGPTPGPWHEYQARPGADSRTIIKSGEWIVAIIESGSAPADRALMTAAPELHDVADELFTLVAEERECYFESHRNQATGEIPDDCQPYLELLDAALNKARAVFAKVKQA